MRLAILATILATILAAGCVRDPNLATPQNEALIGLGQGLSAAGYSLSVPSRRPVICRRQSEFMVICH